MNLAKQSKKRPFTDLSTLVIDEGLRTKFQHFIDQMYEINNEIADKKNQYKETVDAAVEQLNIDPKMLKMVAKIYFDNSLDAKLEEVESLKLALQKLQDMHLLG